MVRSGNAISHVMTSGSPPVSFENNTNTMPEGSAEEPCGIVRIAVDKERDL